MFCPILPYALIVAVVSALAISLFFAAPAAWTQSANVPLHRALENSVGSAPAFGLRICSISFLVLWMAHSIAIPAFWWVDSILRRDVSTRAFWIIVAAIVGFVFFTGLQSTKTSARLALFSVKLGVAILVAAMIRVREGLPDAIRGFPNSDSPLPQFWQGLSHVMFYVAPLAFLAGRFGYTVKGRKELAMTGVMGLAVPLFAALMMIGVTNVATVKSWFYQPSLNPNVAMAFMGPRRGELLARAHANRHGHNVRRSAIRREITGGDRHSDSFGWGYCSLDSTERPGVGDSVVVSAFRSGLSGDESLGRIGGMPC